MNSATSLENPRPSPVQFLFDRFARNATLPAIVWRGRVYTYRDLLARLATIRTSLQDAKVGPGAVVAIEADYSPATTSLMLALIDLGCIVVPLNPADAQRNEELCTVAQVTVRIHINAEDQLTICLTQGRVSHPLLTGLIATSRPGLIVFSSGSSGEAKAIVHDFGLVLQKFATPGSPKRMITFLLFDHMGGLNTLFHILAASGCVVTVTNRAPDTIAAAIAEHQVQILPTSPTFLNLFLLSECHQRHDLSSLELITYGTEPMPEATLKRLRQVLPQVRLQQTYGLSEFGVMRSKSKDSDSLWIKLGGDGYNLRVVNRMLEIKSDQAMLGYLNAPSPFSEDGWFRTGDEVEVEEGYLRILGRKSEQLNVAGEKFFPAEVEGVLQDMEGVAEVAVSAEDHPLTGQIVVAHVKITGAETLAEFKERLRQHCQGRLSRPKIPRKIILSTAALHGPRFKKMRPKTAS